MIFNRPELWYFKDKEAQNVTLTLIGSGDVTWCYIQIDGIKYYNEGIIAVDSGTDVYCYANTAFNMGAIYFNDDVVANLNIGHFDYTFTVKTNTSINFAISRKTSEIFITES